MSSVVVIGEGVAGYRLAGAHVVEAEGPVPVRAAWDALPEDTGLVLLTPAARAALGAEPDRRRLLVAVIPT